MSEPLGPAVMDDFPQAVGLHELLSGERSDARGAAPPAPAAIPAPAPTPEAVEIPKDLLKNTLVLFDSLLSNMALGVETEPPETMQQLSESLAPLANYYAQGHPTVAVLWAGASIALAGYGYAKYARVRERQAAEAAQAALAVDHPSEPTNAAP